MSSVGRRRVRWWPALVVVTLAVGLLVATWTGEGEGQERVMRTLGTLLLAGVLLLLWALLFSRLRGRIRLGILGVVGVLLAALVLLVRIEGVDGDLRPLLRWRWSPEATPPTVGSGDGVDVTPGALDFPRFLGPAANGGVGVRLEPDWDSHPPRELWRRPIGPGWAGFAVVGDLAITHAQHGPDEVVVALDLRTGDPRWSYQYAARYETTVGGVGPRTVPTVAGGRVFTLGATGILTALDLATGRRTWQRDLPGETGVAPPEWGKSGAPLVIGDRVIVSAGGRDGDSLLALRTENASPEWRSGSDRASYSSPVAVTLAGRPQVVLLGQDAVVGHDAESGRVLWRVEVPSRQPNVAPILPLDDDSFLVSVGYGIGSRRIRVEADSAGGFRAETLWTSTRLKSKFANLILDEGVVYGLDDGVLVALDPETGDRHWKRGRYGHGQLLMTDRHLLVQTERGEIVLLEVDREGPEEVARLEVFDGKSWNPPALAGPYLVLRNHEEAVVYELPLAPEP